MCIYFEICLQNVYNVYNVSLLYMHTVQVSLPIPLVFCFMQTLCAHYLIWLCLSKTVNCVPILSVFNSSKLSFIIT